jgi:hypothetical protein
MLGFDEIIYLYFLLLQFIPANDISIRSYATIRSRNYFTNSDPIFFCFAKIWRSFPSLLYSSGEKQYLMIMYVCSVFLFCFVFICLFNFFVLGWAAKIIDRSRLPFLKLCCLFNICFETKHWGMAWKIQKLLFTRRFYIRHHPIHWFWVGLPSFIFTNVCSPTYLSVHVSAVFRPFFLSFFLLAC